MTKIQKGNKIKRQQDKKAKMKKIQKKTTTKKGKREKIQIDKKTKLPTLGRGPKGPQSPPQELEQGGPKFKY